MLEANRVGWWWRGGRPRWRQVTWAGGSGRAAGKQGGQVVDVERSSLMERQEAVVVGLPRSMKASPMGGQSRWAARKVGLIQDAWDVGGDAVTARSGLRWAVLEHW